MHKNTLMYSCLIWDFLTTVARLIYMLQKI